MQLRRGRPQKGVFPTPSWLYVPLHAIFHFALDVAALAENAKCARFYSPRENGLVQPWDADANFGNPPYGCEPGTEAWVAKARAEWVLRRNVIVNVLPIKPETAWWQDLVKGQNRVVASAKWTGHRFAGCFYRLQEREGLVEVLERRSRVAFPGGEPVNGKSTGWFASAIVVFGARPRLGLSLAPGRVYHPNPRPHPELVRPRPELQLAA